MENNEPELMGSQNTDDRLDFRIYALTFFNNKLTLSTNDRKDFWLEIAPTIGWIKFEKHSTEDEFIPNGALFVATELRSACDFTPYPIIQARCVLWRQREAVLSAVKTAFFSSESLIF
ncbi:hypothetical protein [Arsenophonus sp. PmNCSU2021_1]|uniref:hypothetical protein n=1 Tax=Arsenophonus sp. PmNCSU2021_1 TaxID=3118989 RepID=UPI002FF0B312